MATGASRQVRSLETRLAALERQRTQARPPRRPWRRRGRAAATRAAPGRSGPAACAGRAAASSAAHTNSGPDATSSPGRGRCAAHAGARRGCRRAGDQLRGALRHPLGRVGRRVRALPRRRLPGALLDRAGPDRAGRARLPRRAARRRADRGRRMDPPQRAVHRLPGTADRAHPQHPDRRRHGRRLRDRLCGLCALRLRRCAARLRAARHRRAGDARRRAAARAGARRARPGRRRGHALSRLHRQAQLLGALRLSRGRHRRHVRARPRPAVALARRHRDRVRRAVDVSRHRRDARAVRSVRTPSTPWSALRSRPC